MSKYSDEKVEMLIDEHIELVGNLRKARDILVEYIDSVPDDITHKAACAGLDLALKTIWLYCFKGSDYRVSK